MPRTNHPRRPVNDELVLVELDRRMAGRGNGIKTALDLDTGYSHLRSMRAGYEPVTMKVAEALGFELRWVRRIGEGKVAAIELFKADGTTAGIFYCSLCRIVHRTQEEAEFCHGERVCACGKKIESIHSRQSKCGDCDDAEWKEKERKRETDRFEAATKIPALEYKGEHVYLDDKYFDSVEDAIDQYLEGQEPEYVWACIGKNLPEVDLEDVTSNLIDNMWEDADTSDLNGVDELEAALKAFNEANKSIQLWEPDYSTAILVSTH